MAYKKRKEDSGFEKYCSIQLRKVKKATSAGTRSKAATKYVHCLNSRGIKTGLKEKEKKD